MPKRGKSCIFFLPRRKEGEDLDAPRHIRVSYEALERLFQLPLKHAAREIGLCPTTFKKACRRFDLEQWPFRQKQGHFARRASETDGVHAGIRTLHQEPVCAPAAPTLQTTGAHQANHAVSVSCTSPVWQDGMWDTSSFAPLEAPSYIDTLTRGSVVIGRPITCPSPVWHDASLRASRDTSSFGFPFSSIACSSSNVGASSEPHRDCATPLETGPPRERSCVEAVMDYLDLGCSISEADVESMLSDDCSL